MFARNIIFDTVFKTVFHATKLIFDHIYIIGCMYVCHICGQKTGCLHGVPLENLLLV